jgi:hypothetical protein
MHWQSSPNWRRHGHAASPWNGDGPTAPGEIALFTARAMVPDAPPPASDFALLKGSFDSQFAGRGPN